MTSDIANASGSDLSIDTRLISVETLYGSEFKEVLCPKAIPLVCNSLRRSKKEITPSATASNPEFLYLPISSITSISIDVL